MINLDTDKPGQHTAGYRNLALGIRETTNPSALGPSKFWRDAHSAAAGVKPFGFVWFGSALLLGLLTADLLNWILL